VRNEWRKMAAGHQDEATNVPDDFAQYVWRVYGGMAGAVQKQARFPGASSVIAPGAGR